MRTLLVLGACVLIAGCGKKAAPSEKPAAAKSPKPNPEKQNVSSGPGETVTYGKDTAREKLYTARWQDAQVSLGEKGLRSVRMSAVSGEMFKKNKEQAVYRADGGRTIDGTDVLALAGNVRVEGREPKSILTCRKLEYHPGRQAVRAVGDVRLNSRDVRIDGFAELWVSDDGRTFGTAELFPPKKR